MLVKMFNNCQCEFNTNGYKNIVLTDSSFDIYKTLKYKEKILKIDICSTGSFSPTFGIYTIAGKNYDKYINADLYCVECKKLFLTVDQFNDLKILSKLSFKSMLKYLQELKHVK